MDNATKRELKQPDQFITLTEHGAEWAKNNRQTAIMAGVAAVVVILAIVGGYVLFQHHSTTAATASRLRFSRPICRRHSAPRTRSTSVVSW